MISEKQRAERLRRHEELKGYLEVKLAVAESESDKKHLIARIAEVQRDIDATKLPEVALSEPKALLPKILETAEEDAEKAEEPKKRVKKTKVGNPF
jgi:predicted metal-dependent phosphoesterase TrpH